jgi:hypothetical protein
MFYIWNMTTATLKKQLHKTIDNINDNALLEAVYVLLNNKKQTLKPLTEADFYKRNGKSQQDIIEGRLYTQASVKKRFK